MGVCARNAPGVVWASPPGVWQQSGVVCAGLRADAGTPIPEDTLISSRRYSFRTRTKLVPTEVRYL